MTDDDLRAIEVRVEPYLQLTFPWDYIHEDEDRLIRTDIPALLAEVRRLRADIAGCDHRVLRLKRPRRPAAVTA